MNKHNVNVGWPDPFLDRALCSLSSYLWSSFSIDTTLSIRQSPQSLIKVVLRFSIISFAFVDL